MGSDTINFIIESKRQGKSGTINCGPTMKILKVSENNFNMECSHEELSVILNARSNIPQAVDESEYTSLIGVPKASVNKILGTLAASLQEK